ncbi:MAG: hypothetical protein ACXAEL_05750, partial [Candidatus Hodarchaeales archaeon]
MPESTADELRERFDDLIGESRQVSTIAESILPVLQALEKKIEDYQTKISRFDDEITKKEESIKDLQSRVSELEKGRDNALTELKEQEERYLNTTAELENRVRAAKAKATELQDKFETMQREISDLQTANTE